MRMRIAKSCLAKDLSRNVIAGKCLRIALWQNPPLSAYPNYIRTNVPFRGALCTWFPGITANSACLQRTKTGRKRREIGPNQPSVSPARFNGVPAQVCSFSVGKSRVRIRLFTRCPGAEAADITPPPRMNHHPAVTRSPGYGPGMGPLSVVVL